MNATAEKGIWQDVFENGAIVTIDTNHNIIRVKGLRGNPIKYEFDHDITITDVAQIRHSHEKDCRAKQPGQATTKKNLLTQSQKP